MLYNVLMLLLIDVTHRYFSTRLLALRNFSYLTSGNQAFNLYGFDLIGGLQNVLVWIAMRRIQFVDMLFDFRITELIHFIQFYHTD